MTNESFEKYSAASKARWARFSPEERKAKMSAVAKAGWAKRTPEERLARARLMVEARIIKTQTHA